jgi:hypothetical protein
VPRFFNLLEAERALPEVERLLRSLISLKDDYQQAESQLTRIAQRIALSGGMIPPRDEIGLLRQQKDANARAIKAAVERIQEIGCQLKDLDTGLVDFPTLYCGQEVYLCWKLGESGITYWHHVEDGFKGRRPIDKEFLENHHGEE